MSDRRTGKIAQLPRDAREGGADLFHAKHEGGTGVHPRCTFEDRTVRIDPDPRLRADLRAIKKEVTAAGKIRFAAESDGGAAGHCARSWAKALRHHAAKRKIRFGAVVVD